MQGAGEAEVESHLEQCEPCAQLLESLEPDSSAFVQSFKRLALNASRVDTVYDSSCTVVDRLGRSVPSPGMKLTGDSKQRWKLVRKLATGGIGEIWIAEDLLFGREVAVKRLRKETAALESVQRRFINEAKITAQLSHPGIVYVLDLVDDGPRSFYVMSLVKGKTLWHRVMKFHQALQNAESSYYEALVELLRIWTVVANTIAFAHDHGVLHRDLKSDNIVVGDYGQVTVIDWGLAKSMASSRSNGGGLGRTASVDDSLLALDARRGTVSGSRLGTPAFMAPEQARGDVAAIDRRTDTYALSAMLYEILTGQTPHSAEDPEEMMRAVQFDSLVPPAELVADVPCQLDEICCKGLAKNPDDRFQSAGELSSAVEQWMAKEAIRRQSDQARQQLFEMSDDLMLIFDQQHRVTWTNAAWKRVLGRDLGAMVDGVGRGRAHEASGTEVENDIEFFEQIAIGKAVKGIRRRVLAADGKPRWYSWTATLVADEGITVAIGRDIDDLVNKSEELDAMLDVAPEAIVVINPDRSIHRINSQVAEMFGYEADELIALPIETLIPSRFHVVFDRFFKRYIKKPSARPFLKRAGLQGQHKDGSLFKLGVRFSPVFLDRGFRIVCSIRRKTDEGANRSPEVP